MLVLTRRIGQSLRIGPNVEVRVVRFDGDRVVLGITAPRHVAVVRSELIDEILGEAREASDARAKLRVLLAPLHVAAAQEAPDDRAPEDPGPEDPTVA